MASSCLPWKESVSCLSYWGLTEVPDSILISHRWFQDHWFCQVIQLKQQVSDHCSIDLLQSFLLLWAPFKTVSLSSHHINALENYSQMQSEVQDPKRHTKCYISSLTGDGIKYKTCLHPWKGCSSMSQTIGPLKTSLMQQAVNSS